MMHYTSEQWLKFKNRDISECDRLLMEEHLLDCPACMTLYLDLIDEFDLSHTQKYIPPDFTQSVMQAVASESEQAACTQSPAVTQLRKVRRRIMAFYAIAATLTIALTGTGFFDTLLQKASDMPSLGFKSYLAEKHDTLPSHLPTHNSIWDGIDLKILQGGTK